MKRLFFISFIIILVQSFAIGQNKDFKPFYSLGIKQGVNYSTVNFSPGINQGVTLGYQGGLVFKYQNEKLFGLQLELNYTQKGWTEAFDTIDNSYNRKMNYIELPLITQVVMGKRPNFKYYVNLGTSFAYLLSEKEELEVNEELYRRVYYEKEIENRFDYSVLGELGFTYNTGIGEFQLGVRYQLTFTDLFDITEEEDVVDIADKRLFDNFQNQLWNVSISYFFLSNRY